MDCLYLQGMLVHCFLIVGGTHYESYNYFLRLEPDHNLGVASKHAQTINDEAAMLFPSTNLFTMRL